MQSIDLKLLGKHFYNLGFNMTCITNYRNEFNLLDRNLFKAPNHEWLSLNKRRQTLEELDSYDWNHSIGIGTVLGYKNLMAIDIDGCLEINFISWICKVLDIKKDYSWIVQSGSGVGYHLIFYCNDRPDIKSNLDSWSFINLGGITPDNVGINAYYPKKSVYESYYGIIENENQNQEVYVDFLSSRFHLPDLFQKIEFRWTNHIVLPISLHECGMKYNFINELPKTSPCTVKFENLQELHMLICSNKAGFSGWEGTADHNIAYEDELSVSLAQVKYNAKYTPYYLVFDLESNGLPITEKTVIGFTEKMPEIVQIAWLVVNGNNNIINHRDYVISPDYDKTNDESLRIHGISKEIASLIGFDFKMVISEFLKEIDNVDFLVCYNYKFISKILVSNLEKYGFNPKVFLDKPYKCLIDYAKRTHNFGNQNIYPKLSEIYEKIFSKEIQIKHNAFYDSLVTKVCFKKLTTH